MAQKQKTLIGELLIAKKAINEQQLQTALESQAKTGKKLGQTLIELGYIAEKTFLELLAQHLQIPFIDLSRYDIDPTFTRQLLENYARSFQAILLKQEDDHYLIGMVDPQDVFALDELTRVLKYPLKLALVSETSLQHMLNQIYRRTAEISDFAGKLDLELQHVTGYSAEESQRKQVETAVVKMLNSLFEDAVQINASDIHIEPAENFLRIRTRVDGFLHEQIIREFHIAAALSRRLKLMSGLNIAEQRMPQDGRLNINVLGQHISIRLSTMPTQYGESIVMRLLNQSQRIVGLDDIGMSKEVLQAFRKLIKLPQGIILVTGPTGSGKTTTLYSALNEINDVAKNIITIEDPVEHRIDRINQVQVNSELGLTFARILRSTLRQDPNIILVGEIRDQETASIAVRAALTGHLVLSTLHTNDAASSVIRLVDMGVESYLVAATTKAVLAQRLVRRICTSCVEAYKPSLQELGYFPAALEEDLKNQTFYHGVGCTQCNHTGYKGRIGVFELLTFDAEMIEAIRHKDTHAYMSAVAKNRKTPTLLISAVQMAKAGITSLEEVLRVAGGEKE